MAASLSPPVWVIYCDSSALPNPGRIGVGAIPSAPDGTRHTLSQLAPARACNNEAEHRALMAALCQAQSHGARALVIYCDSRLLVTQLGAAQVKPVARLIRMIEQARALLQSFEWAHLPWIPRQRNTQADALARAALGRQPKRAGKRSKK